MTNLRTRDRGFSLIEVTVAFAIAAISLGVLGNIFGNGSRNLTTTRQYNGAVELAETLIAEHGRQRGVLTPLITESNTDYQWTVTTQPHDGEADIGEPRAPDEIGQSMPLYLIEMTVDVTWGNPNSPRGISISTLRPRNRLQDDPDR
ncbi:MAG: general secretion pathway protein I [Gammaproteobacteria bacterium]|jgi:general secretion pathway protein I